MKPRLANNNGIIAVCRSA